MEEYIKKHKNISYMVTYTVLFVILFIGVYFIFLKNQLSFVQYPDGYLQYYPKMIYVAEYIKEIFGNFVNGIFEIPQFGWDIGLGEDIWLFVGTWISDLPFSLLFLLVGSDNYEKIYALNIIIKIYLAGCSFSYVCIKWNKNRRNVLLGTLVYVFSGYLMRISPMHPAFIMLFVLFPLVIYGLDKIIHKQSAKLFIFAFACLMIRGYYGTYIVTVIAFLYGVVRYFTIYKKIVWKEFGGIVGKAIGAYIMAFIMGMVTMFPAIISYFESTRSAGTGSVEFWYSIEYYKSIICGLVLPPGDYDYPAVVSIVVPFLVMPFIYQRKQNKEKCILLICSLMIFLSPILGSVLNGLNYPSNRWSFTFIFLAAVCVLDGMNQILNISKFQWLLLTGIIGTYGTVVLLLMKGKTKWILIPVLLLFLFWALFSLVYFKKKSVRYLYIIILGCVMINVLLNGQLTFTDKYGNIAIEYIEKNEVNSKIARTTGRFAFDEYDSDYYRINSTNLENVNFSMLNNVSTPNVYNSVLNSAFPQHLKEIHAQSRASDFWIEGVDNRIQVESLLGVKYYISTDETKQYLPYGFELEKDLGEGYYLYKNPYALPMVYTYDKCISKKEYECLEVLDKQRIVLDTAVVDDEQVMREIQEVSQIDADNVERDYKIVNTEGVSWEQGVVTVTSDENYIEIQFDEMLDGELYIELEGVNIKDSQKQNGEIQMQYGEVKKTLSVTSPDYTWHYPNDNPWINLGKLKEDTNSIFISFSEEGSYYLENLNVYSNEFTDMGLVSKGEDDVTNLKRNGNTIKCNVNFEESKILNFNIPYSNNWKILVDGKRIDTIQINALTIGGIIDKGQHDIEMIYETKFLKETFFVSICGWIIFFFFCLYEKYYSTKHKDNRE